MKCGELGSYKMIDHRHFVRGMRYQWIQVVSHAAIRVAMKPSSSYQQFTRSQLRQLFVAVVARVDHVEGLNGSAIFGVTIRHLLPYMIMS